MTTQRPTFFADAAAFRRWLTRHHATATELIVAMYKKASGKPSITYLEALDEALCFGWIDGVRRSLGEDVHTVRFTPRKAKSYWSAVNTKKAMALIRARRMHRSGLAVFQARDKQRTAEYAFERATRTFEPGHVREFRKHPAAWAFFASQPPGYRRQATWYVIGAKREETRAKRLAFLIDRSSKRLRLPHVHQPKRPL